jgi:hypothetical protein
MKGLDLSNLIDLGMRIVSAIGCAWGYLMKWLGVSALIALGALIFSALTYREVRRAARSAFLTAKVRCVSVTSNKCVSLVIHNSGKSEARNIRVLITKQPINNDPPAKGEIPKETVIGPGVSYDARAIYLPLWWLSYQATLIWDDDWKRDNSWRHTLSDG